MTLVVVAAIAAMLAVALAPVWMCRDGLFATDEAIEEDQRDARHHADRHHNPQHLIEAAEVRQHRAMRQFAFLLFIVPSLLVVAGFTVFAALGYLTTLLDR